MRKLFRAKSIGKAITIIFTVTSILLFITIVTVRVMNTKHDLEERKEKMLSLKKNEIKGYVSIAYKVIENAYDKSISEEEIKAHAGEKLKQMTSVLLSSMESYYNQNKGRIEDGVLKEQLKQMVKDFKGAANEYFWITDNTLPYPTMIMHPNSPQLDGQVLNSAKYNCAMGKNQNLFQAMVEACNLHGEGFVNYVWDKPTDNGVLPNVPKLSYVKIFKPYNWVIGTGVYIDDIENNIKQECINTIENMRYDNGFGYFWINDTEEPYPRMIMHATMPELNGKVMDDKKFNCAMGENRNIFQAILEVCDKHGEGFVDYIWDKPVKDGVKKDQPKLSFVKKFDKWGWIVGTGVYLDDIYEEIETIKSDFYKKLAIQIFVLFIAFVVLYVVLLLYIRRVIIKPIYQIKDRNSKLQRGVFPEKIEIEADNEIGDIVKSTNSLIETLTKVKDFVVNVGRGKLDVKFEALSEEDELGTSLLEMQRNLIEARTEEEKRKEEDRKQNWVTQGLAKFANILRDDSEDINQLAYSIISNLVNYLDANQGGFFLLNDVDEDESSDYNKRYYWLVAAYAYNRQKMMKKQILWGEGLVGRCGYERQTIFMTDVPNSYIEITSGLGADNPRCLLLVPLTFNDEIFGVIEVASFNVLEKYQIEFVEKLSENIASAIAGVQVNNRTKKLLEQSRQQAEELQAQEEEMRQNLEEMQATKEEMERAKQVADVAINNLNSVKTPIISIDNNFNITYINEAGIEVSGLSKEQALQKKCYEIWKNPHCNTSECRCAMAMKSKKAETGATTLEGSGEKIVYTGTPIIEDGIVTGAIEEIIFVNDIKEYL